MILKKGFTLRSSCVCITTLERWVIRVTGSSSVLHQLPTGQFLGNHWSDSHLLRGQGLSLGVSSMNAINRVGQVCWYRKPRESKVPK